MAIAAIVVVFSAVNAIVFRPLPIRQPERVVVLSETSSIRGQTVKEVSYRNFVDWRAESRSFEGMAAISSTILPFVLDRAGQLMRFEAALVSASFFDRLGTAPQLGRALVPQDDVRGARRVLVLSDRFWRQQFGGDASAIGTEVVVSDQPFTIVGVMPPDFAFPRGADAWTPVVPALAAASAEAKVDTLEARHFGLLSVVGRLLPGVSAEQARAELDVIARRLPESDVEERGLAVTATETSRSWRLRPRFRVSARGSAYRSPGYLEGQRDAQCAGGHARLFRCDACCAQGRPVLLVTGLRRSGHRGAVGSRGHRRDVGENGRGIRRYDGTGRERCGRSMAVQHDAAGRARSAGSFSRRCRTVRAGGVLSRSARTGACRAAGDRRQARDHRTDGAVAGRTTRRGRTRGRNSSLAVVANRMSPLLFQVPARDLFTFTVAAGLLGATTLAAGYLAARRVTRIDPMMVMRAP